MVVLTVGREQLLAQMEWDLLTLGGTVAAIMGRNCGDYCGKGQWLLNQETGWLYGWSYLLVQWKGIIIFILWKGILTDDGREYLMVFLK